MNAYKKVILCSAAVIPAISFSFVCLSAADALKKHNAKCDYLFILGGQVIGENTPSDDLMSRINAAEIYLKENPDTIAIVCGGCFRKGQTKSEAEIIKTHLVNSGIEENRILLEDKSTTTVENFKFGKEILLSFANKNLYELNVGFLSSDYHMFRAGVLAKKNGLPGIKKVGVDSKKSKLKGFLREAFVGWGMFQI